MDFHKNAVNRTHRTLDSIFQRREGNGGSSVYDRMPLIVPTACIEQTSPARQVRVRPPDNPEYCHLSGKHAVIDTAENAIDLVAAAIIVHGIDWRTVSESPTFGDEPVDCQRGRAERF